MGAKEAGSARERFVLAEDLRLLLEKSSTIDPGLRPQIQLRVRAAERELALFDAASAGIRGAWEDVDEDSLTEARASALTSFAQNYRTGAMLAALIDPRPGLVMADVNPACERATGMARTAIGGKSLFALFPDNPNDPASTGVSNLYASLRRVAESGRWEPMDRQRYDTQDPDGIWEERYWLQVNRPVRDAAGRLLFVLHLVEELP